MKKYFDAYRGKGIPEAIQGKVKGELMPDQSKMRMWRNWRTGLVYSDAVLNIRIIGALDDCLVDNGRYTPLDYKTKGSEPKTDGSEYYQLQLDFYALLLESNGYKPSGIAHLAYFWPKVVQDTGPIVGQSGEKPPYEGPGDLGIEFSSKVFTLEVDSNRARDMMARAKMILESTSVPDPSENCEYCRYTEELNQRSK